MERWNDWNVIISFIVRAEYPVAMEINKIHIGRGSEGVREKWRGRERGREREEKKEGR